MKAEFPPLPTIEADLIRLAEVALGSPEASGTVLDTYEWEPPRPLTSSTVSNVRCDQVIVAVDLRGKVFRGAVLQDVHFKDCDLAGVNFSGATLKNVNFSGSNLSQSSFTGAKLIGCTFSDSVLNHPNFDSCEVIGGKWSRVKIAGGSIRNADLSNVEIHAMNAISIELDASTFNSCSFSNGHLRQVHAKGTGFLNCRFQHARLDFGSEIERRIIYMISERPENTVLHVENFGAVDLHAVHVAFEYFPVSTRFDGSKFNDVRLTGHLREASFRGVTMRNGKLQAVLSHTDWSGAIIQDLEVEDGSVLISARFDGAMIDRASFVGVNICGADFGTAEASKVRFNRASITRAASLMLEEGKIIQPTSFPLSGFARCEVHVYGENGQVTSEEIAPAAIHLMDRLIDVYSGEGIWEHLHSEANKRLIAETTPINSIKDALTILGINMFLMDEHGAAREALRDLEKYVRRRSEVENKSLTRHELLMGAVKLEYREEPIDPLVSEVIELLKDDHLTLAEKEELLSGCMNHTYEQARGPGIDHVYNALDQFIHGKPNKADQILRDALVEDLNNYIEGVFEKDLYYARWNPQIVFEAAWYNFRLLARLMHPDVSSLPPADAEQAFKRIKEAHEYLQRELPDYYCKSENVTQLNKGETKRTSRPNRPIAALPASSSEENRPVS